jgi:MFS family permease
MTTRVRLGRNYWKLWSASVISNLGDGISLVAYPWLASAVTRNAVLIALIVVVQRLPWLIFSLPAGVITDRVDRRQIILWMNVVAFAMTLGVALLVLAGQDSLPDPDVVDSGDATTGPSIYLVLLYVSALVFGLAEVLRDNASQTILPAIVEPEGLERANGTLWGAEMVGNSFVGPPLAGLLIAIGFSVPFFFDAATFALAAVLIAVMAGRFVPSGADVRNEKVAWGTEIAEGFRWLWRHPLLRTLAILLGIINALGMMEFSILVLFAQEVLVIDATLFGVLLTAGAVGGVVGSFSASRVSTRLGSGITLQVVLLGAAAGSLVIGITSSWLVVYVAFAVGNLLAVLWNVITVSLRQTIVPDELLGRVNSVYRFFGWGMMPLGAALGGAMVWVFEGFMDREMALRMPFLVNAALYVVVFAAAAPKLTTAKIEVARAEAPVRGTPSVSFEPE